MKQALRKSLAGFQPLLFAPVLCLLFMAGRCSPPPKALRTGEQKRTVFVGTYTRTEGHVDGKAEGIYRLTANLETGALSDETLVAEVINPSFVTVRKKNDLLFAVSELAQKGEPTGFVHAYRIVKGGGLYQINKLPTDGLAPCHVELDQNENFVVVSNYVGGVAMVYKIERDGRLTAVDKFEVPTTAKQGKDSWLHSANFSPDNRIVAICDKGLDRVWLFSMDESTGKLTPTRQGSIALPEGSGPRHAKWSDNGEFLYVINELSNTVTVLNRQGGDVLSLEQTISTLPKGYREASYCADIHLHPSGQFLYGSNRGHNSIAIFSVNPETGLLTAADHQSTEGEYPRNFAISPNGKYLYAANQNTSNVATFRIDPNDGKLIKTEQAYEIPTPVCLEFTE
ncbi:lactonase family protein [Lewinella sp. 4G2]|uniref:lactonase family protein n=1 Tax=Lewinella sp. 4G2 TaxID=1803372 RepID=UPI0007B4F2D5|nr:lactonase family protein [Lewinella sp. 4G2]OAV45481.1 hypothetical protein A3850_013720 [Lewinella sp. 4G2]